MTQKFKGDAIEDQIAAAGSVAFDLTAADLQSMYEGAYNASDFLLMLYDEGRMPFSDRVPREAFVSFIRQAIPNAQFTGSFESYIFLLQAIFGEGSELIFGVPAAGKLTIDINVALSGLEFQFISRELVDGSMEISEMQTSFGDNIVFAGISGIDTGEELEQLLSELIPAGIFPTITLTFFIQSQWTAIDDMGVIDTMVDFQANTIIFYEIGD